MKLKSNTDNIWRHGTHQHRAKLNRRGADRWERQIFRKRADGCPEFPEPRSQYPPSTVGMFNAAIRRCPSISIDEEVMDGQPCIAGTRVPVRSVLRTIEQYGSVEEAVRCYPQLNAEQVKDALYFSQIVLELPDGIDKAAAAS